ncbi:MAG: AMP-binding protein [Myxococcales bacterium]|nr:AMP-binding protein [Myxococcales bacterium]
MSTPDVAATLLEILRDLIATVGDGRGLGNLGLDANLERELGLGSLERVELLGRVEARFNLKLPEEAISVVETPRQLLKLVEAALGTPAASDSPAESAPRGPATLPQSPPAPPPARAATLVEVLEYHAQEQPDRTHILLLREDGREDPITYGELRREAGAVAAALRGMGLKPGGTVAIMLPTGRGYFASFLGAMLAGGVPVPLYPPFRLDRIAEYIAREAKILDNAGTEVLLTFDRAARVADMIRDQVAVLRHVASVDAILAGEAPPSWISAEVTRDDTALLQYTSGSTGDPKGVELTQANVLANIRAAAAACQLTGDDVMVSWLPLYHDMGLIGGWLMSFYFGNPTVLMSPVTFLSRPERWLEALSRYRGTISVSPNFAFDLCVRRITPEQVAGLDLSCARALLNGSEPILPHTLDRFAAHLAPAGLRPEALFCAYGLAENMVAVTFPPVLRRPRVDRIDRKTFERSGRAEPVPSDSSDCLAFVGCGSAVPLHEIRVVDKDGRPLPDRRQGSLQFRGPSAFKGYYRNPEATARVKQADGWNDTGDLAYLVDGEVFITGRVKDLIIKGGRNYYPHEIEAAAGAVAGVRQGCVAAFALRDEHAGTESIVVVAETKEQRPELREQLTRAIGEAIAAAVGVPPDRVVLTRPGAVPKTSSGKIRRSETRELYLHDALGKSHGSVYRQAAGLIVRGLPRRAADAARRAGEVAYGTWAAGVFASIVGAAIAASPLIADGAPLRRTSVRIARAGLRAAGLAPTVVGREHLPEGPCVIVANHASYLDAVALLTALPSEARFVIKGEMERVPVLGRLMRRCDHVLIDRRSAERSLAGLGDLAARLRDGQPLVLFPEGTFTHEAGLRPFKLGAFRLAAECAVPVVPVVLRGTRAALRDGTVLPRHAAVEIEVLRPLRPDGAALADIVRLRDHAADAIAARLGEPRLHAVMVAGLAGVDG